MSFTLVSVAPNSIFSDGGRMLVVTGIFEKGHRYKVYLGDTGTVIDPECYSGIPGQGNLVFPRPSLLGGIYDTLVAYSPKVVANPIPYSITVLDYDTLEAQFLGSVVTTIKPQFFTSVYATRRLYPPDLFVGPKDVSREKPVEV